MGAGGVNDSVFINSHAAASAGAVQIGNSENPSHVEFHRCSFLNSTAGENDNEDDPQGEGGTFGVSKGSKLVLVNTTVQNSLAIKKVCFQGLCCCILRHYTTRFDAIRNPLPPDKPLEFGTVCGTYCISALM